MPSNSFARLLTPTALGAALLGLSATLFALDVGGTVALNAPSATPPNAPANASGAPSENSLVAENNNAEAGTPANNEPRPAEMAGAAAGESTVAALAVPAERSAAPLGPPARPAKPAPAKATPHRAAPFHAATLPVRPAAPVRHAMAAQTRSIVLPETQRPAAVIHSEHPARIAVVLPAAPSTVSAPAAAPIAAPARRAVADLRDVRHYAMSKLLKKYPHLSVISADTYPVGDGRVRVAMVVRNGNQRWIEKDDVRRSGAQLALLGSKRRAMPYTLAQSSPVAPEPNPGP